jgi:hypothetical protein
MHRYPLSVDARLRIVLAHLDTLKLPARTVGRHPDIAQLRTPATLASWLVDMSEAATSHVSAIHLALPVDSLTLNAPSLRRGR